MGPNNTDICLKYDHVVGWQTLKLSKFKLNVNSINPIRCITCKCIKIPQSLSLKPEMFDDQAREPRICLSLVASSF